MKTLIIILALILSAPIYAGDLAEAPQQQIKQSKLKKQTPEQAEIYRLKVANANLQTQLRDANRRYYAEKDKVVELEEQLKSEHSEDEEPTEEMYTRTEVEGFLNQRQSETWYNNIIYMVAEEKFLLTLDNIDDAKWLAKAMIRMNMDRIIKFKGIDDSYNADIAKVQSEYQSYYDKARAPAEVQE